MEIDGVEEVVDGVGEEEVCRRGGAVEAGGGEVAQYGKERAGAAEGRVEGAVAGAVGLEKVDRDLEAVVLAAVGGVRRDEDGDGKRVAVVEEIAQAEVVAEDGQGGAGGEAAFAVAEQDVGDGLVGAEGRVEVDEIGDAVAVHVRGVDRDGPVAGGEDGGLGEGLGSGGQPRQQDAEEGEEPEWSETGPHGGGTASVLRV